MPGAQSERRVVVINPASGSEDHVDTVVELAAERGFDARVTEREGDARRLTRDVADGVDLVAAAGGDGTVNEVVNGIVDASALGSTVLGVVPAGTGNNFATNVGVDGIEAAFDVIDGGRRRDIDLGIANDRAFVNSCIGGVTAEASKQTSSDQKRDLGVLAYVVNTLEQVRSFDALPLRVDVVGESTDDGLAWEGEALFVFVGNARRFSGTRTAQANVEDGQFEVIVVEQAPPTDLVGQAALGRFFDRDGEPIVRRRTPSLRIECLERSVEYSLDGEMLETDNLDIDVASSPLTVAVGEGYAPDPDVA